MLQNKLEVEELDATAFSDLVDMQTSERPFAFLKKFLRGKADLILTCDRTLKPGIDVLLESNFVEFNSSAGSAIPHRHQTVVISGEGKPDTFCVAEQAVADGMKLAKERQDFRDYLENVIGFGGVDEIPLSFKGEDVGLPTDFREKYMQAIQSQVIENRKTLAIILTRLAQIGFMIDEEEISDPEIVERYWQATQLLQDKTLVVSTEEQVKELQWPHVLLAGIRAGTIHFRRLTGNQRFRGKDGILWSLNQDIQSKIDN